MANHTGFPHVNAAGSATPTGLYDPVYEHDSCGVGFVARITAEADHSIVEHAVSILVNLEHRGAIGGDKATGDGAGLLLQIPDAFFRYGCRELDFPLPPAGQYAAGLVFLPTEAELADRCARTVERVAREEGCPVLGWRDVPVDPDTLGELARMSQPAIRQVFLANPSLDIPSFERKLYVIRRLAEKEVRSWTGCDPGKFYVPSLSSRTIVYKGLLTGSQLTTYFPDLRDPLFASAFGVVHQRYSTNTLPTWHLAHPFRFLAHNGEINTLRGNINRMRAREAVIESELFGADIEKIKPVIIEEGSDSAIFDNALELLLMAGRSLPHAMMMMVPEAFGPKFLMSEDKRAFYEYHSSIMEPWDGPAALVFCDGRYIGATLDRNGLRPARYTVTRDGMIVMASETGVMDFPADRIVQKGRLQPGKMFLVDLEQKRIVPDNEIKSRISRQRPYRTWVKDNRIEMRGLFHPPEIPRKDPEVLVRTQIAFGYTEEDLKMVIAPMASQGQEPVGSMGDDSALAVLSNRPQLLFSYFKQLFAQVTNPPIDPLREELVMSLRSFVGREKNLLDETPEHCRMLKLPHPILTPQDMARLRNATHPDVVAREIDILFPSDGDGNSLEAALSSVFALAENHIRDGATLLILTDRKMDRDHAPIPSLLATSGLHHHLIRAGLGTRAGIIVETGEAREVMHFALLIGYGANAICPYMAFSTVRNLAETGLLEKSLPAGEALDAYVMAVKKGLLKTLSKMGISTVKSYLGAQIFEAVGLGDALVEKYFTGTASRIGGIGMTEIAAETLARHRSAYAEDGRAERLLDAGGLYQVRVGGEKHLWSPEAIYKLQLATRTGDYRVFKEYTRLIDDQAKERATLRSLFRFRKGNPVPLDEVEPVENITPRFVTAAMSYGSISQEVHETIALAMNRLRGRSNCGEGGEDPARYIPLPNGDSLRSRIKQVASGRFGVTTEYLIHGDELQIKMAQGAKPGEGGQLPGHKVSAEIARVRHTTPGVTLISPPPHHDTYSIEDLAQLIHDCKAARVRVIVKLVSSEGIGTIAVGVAKAGADVINVAGNTGGTGAASVTRLRYAGRAAEIGLAEVHQALCANGLRQKVVLRTSGAHQTGRDVVTSALLGADSFEFGTSALMMIGCVMAKNCNIKCPAGLTTNPEVFDGDPRSMAQYLCNVAHDVREILAGLGLPSLAAARGRTDLLRLIDHPAAVTALRPQALLARIDPVAITDPVYLERDYAIDDALGHEVRTALMESRELDVTIATPVLGNRNKSVGAQLAVDIERILNHELTAADAAALPSVLVDDRGRRFLGPESVRVATSGSAGLSYASFCNDGMRLEHTGTCNDGVGKSMSGGSVIVRSPGGGSPSIGGNVLIGNFALFGATGGRLFVEGEAGDRFAVRNSGATAVVEGVGEFACEYMTNGAVLNLGGYGKGLGNGMSGGFLYQYDPACVLESRISSDSVIVGAITGVDDPLAPVHHHAVRQMLEMHVAATDSALGTRLLENWETERHYISYAMPRALVAYQDSDALVASISRRDLLDELSTALAAHQVRALKVSIRSGTPVADGVVPGYGETDNAEMYRLLNAFTVFELARQVASARLARAAGARSREQVSAWTDQAIATGARNLVLTEDFDLLSKVARYARDILGAYDADQLAALIAAKRVDDYKSALAQRNVWSMDAPGTYGWILLQDRKNREKLGGLPGFDELFAAATVPDVAGGLGSSVDPATTKVG